jgi:hypothetical protein
LLLARQAVILVLILLLWSQLAPLEKPAVVIAERGFWEVMEVTVVMAAIKPVIAIELAAAVVVLAGILEMVVEVVILAPPLTLILVV